MNNSTDIKIVRGSIKEMDMTAAGISVLAEAGYLSEDVYWDLREGDKLSRSKSLGECMRDNKELDLAHIVDEGIRQHVQVFIARNQIPEKNILEIAKDAVFVYKTNPKILEFGEYIRFRCKHTYHLMLEFPASEGSHAKIKLYKEYPTGVICRGGNLNRQREEYYILLELMVCILEKDSPKYNQQLRKLSQAFQKTDERLISSVENAWLLQMLKEILL